MQISPVIITYFNDVSAFISSTDRRKSSSAFLTPICVSERKANLKGWANESVEAVKKNNKKSKNLFITYYSFSVFQS